MVTVKVTGLSEARSKFEGMQSRLRDLSPAGDEVDLELSRRHAQRFAVDPVGEMDHLGPSVINPSHEEHVFVASRSKFTFGTDVVYARMWEKQTGRTLVALDEEGRRAVHRVLVEYVRGR